MDGKTVNRRSPEELDAVAQQILTDLGIETPIEELAKPFYEMPHKAVAAVASYAQRHHPNPPRRGRKPRNAVETVIANAANLSEEEKEALNTALNGK